MKNIVENLKTLFKSKTQKVETMENLQSNNAAEWVTNEPLLIEKEEPQVQSEVEHATKKIGLSVFFGRDFFMKGYQDGYRYHSAEVFDNSLRAIRSDFRHIVVKLVDDKIKDLSRLRMQKAEIRNYSLKEAEKIDVRILELESALERLEQEQELASLGEGMVSSAINLYRDGFGRGVAKYNDEKLLLTNSSLF